MIRMLLAVVVVGVAGCGLAEQAEFRKQAEAARITSEAEVRACQVRHPIQRGTYGAYMSCTAKAYEPTLRFRRDADLVRVFLAETQMIGRRVDNGGIDMNLARVDLARARAELVTLQEARQNARAQAAAVEDANQAALAAALLGAAAIGMQRAQPAPMINTSCNRVGNMVNCLSY